MAAGGPGVIIGQAIAEHRAELALLGRSAQLDFLAPLLLWHRQEHDRRRLAAGIRASPARAAAKTGIAETTEEAGAGAGRGGLTRGNYGSALPKLASPVPSQTVQPLPPQLVQRSMLMCRSSAVAPAFTKIP